MFISQIFTLALLALPAFAEHTHRMEKRATKLVPVVSSCNPALNKKNIAITYDDGPNYRGWDADLLKTLKASKANATFFLNGNNWGCIYNNAAGIRALYNTGHQIANHGWSHPDLATLTEAQIDKQFALVETALIKILGVKPLYARAPFGSYNDVVRKVLAKRGYKALLDWTVVSGDADGESASYQLAQYKKVKGLDIVLNHDQYQSTIYDVAPKVIPQLTKSGYKLTTIAQCLKGPDANPKATGPNAYYQVVGKPQQPDSTWTCDGTPAPGQG